MNEALKFIMQFYQISEEVALQYYQDEIIAYHTLLELEKTN